MNRFRQKTESSEPDKAKQSRPLREFKHEPQAPVPSQKMQRIKVAAYWGLPILVLFSIICGGAYLALNFLPEKEEASENAAKAPFALSSDEIEVPELMAAHLNAVGGREALQQVRSVRYEGRVIFDSGEKDFQMLLLKPDKGMLVTNPGEEGSLKLMLNGDFAWQVIERRNGAREVAPMDDASTESLKWSLRVHNTFRRMALEGRYAGLSVSETGYDGRPCYEVSKTMPNGTDYSAVLDKETLYVLKTEETVAAKEGMATFSVVYDDYRMVSGIVEPYRTKLYRNDELDNEVIINSIRFNPGVISSLFKVPEEIRE